MEECRFPSDLYLWRELRILRVKTEWKNEKKRTEHNEKEVDEKRLSAEAEEATEERKK